MIGLSAVLTIVSTIVSLAVGVFSVKKYHNKPDDVTNELRPAVQDTSYVSLALHPNVGHRRGGNREELLFTVTDVHATFQKDLPPNDLESFRAALSLQTTLTLSLNISVLPWIAEVGRHKAASELGDPTRQVLLQILEDELDSDIVESVAFHRAPDAESSPELMVTIATYNISEINAVLNAVKSGLCYAVNSWWLFGQSKEERVEAYHKYKTQQQDRSFYR